MRTSFLIACILLTLTGCDNSINSDVVKVPSVKPEYISTMMVVDDSVIDKKDVQAIIEPLWWSVDIYQTEQIYLAGFKPFSENQKYIFAIQWYTAEVNNGGHDQFFSNSTGIVWKEALKGFEKIGLTENYKILKSAVTKLGGNPSLDRDIRTGQLENSNADFEALDSKFYEVDKEISLETKLFEFINKNRNDFYFKGLVTHPK